MISSRILDINCLCYVLPNELHGLDLPFHITYYKTMKWL